MFLQFEHIDRNRWQLYTLTDVTGRVFHLGCVKFFQLTMMTDVSPDVVIPEGVITLLVIDHDDDRDKLMNRAIDWCSTNNREDLKRVLVSEYTSKIMVVCNETGERFASLTMCAKMHDLSYSALNKHLARMNGYRTVKGRTYSRVGA